MTVAAAFELRCGECGAPMRLRDMTGQPSLPKFEARSRARKFYGCSRFPVCRGTHGAHPDGRPLGIPTDRETAQWRILAHAAFDRLWQHGRWSRKMAYRRMRTDLGYTEATGHIGRFTLPECARVIWWATEAAKVVCAPRRRA